MVVLDRLPVRQAVASEGKLEGRRDQLFLTVAEAAGASGLIARGLRARAGPQQKGQGQAPRRQAQPSCKREKEPLGRRHAAPLFNQFFTALGY